MDYRGVSSTIDIRPIEDKDIEAIYKHSIDDSKTEISGLFRMEHPWAPIYKEDIIEKITEIKKDKHSHVFSFSNNESESVGIGYFSSSWDPWCPKFSMIIWPKFQRKGYGTESAKLIMDLLFNTTIANTLSCNTEEWNTGTKAFITSLGFKECGISRKSGIMNGKFYNDICYDLLKHEYVSKKKKGDV